MPRNTNLEQQTAEWAAFRSTHLGGSDAPRIMYLSGDRYDLWKEKTGRQLPKPATLAMRRGLELEATARTQYSIRMGVFAPPEVLESSRAGESFMGASLDGYIPGKRIIEIKCPSDARTHLDAKEGIVEEAYWVQMQHCMHVAEVETCDYVSFFQDDLQVFPVKYDPEYVNNTLVPAEREFMNWVKANSYPFPQANDEPVAIPRDSRAWEVLQAVLDYRRMREDTQRRERVAEAELKCLLAECGKAVAPDGTIIHWERRRGNINFKSIPEVEAILKSGINLDEHRWPDSLNFRIERSK